MLVLQSYDSELPWVKSTTASVREAVQKVKDAPRFLLDIEYLDLARELQPDYRSKLKELIHIKYRNKQPDILLSIDTLAAFFCMELKSDLFKDIPVVFSVTTETYKQLKGLLPDQSAVVINEVDHAGTLELALSIFPETRHVHVIGGQTKGGRISEEKVRQISRPYTDTLQFHYLSHLDYNQILQAVESLPENSIVFQLIFLADTAGRKHIPIHVVKQVSQRANAPVFSLYDPHIGHGTVGGQMVQARSVQENAVRLAAALLEHPKSAPGTIVKTAGTPVFDWQQLQRWHIKEKMLPKGSQILFKEYSFFELHRSKVLFWGCLTIAQALLIFFLVVNLIRQKKTERSLLESQDRLEESHEELLLRNFVLENAPMSVFWFDETGAIIYANNKAASSYGYENDELLNMDIRDIDMTMSKDRLGEIRRRMNVAGSFNTESVHIRQDGARFPAEIYFWQSIYKNKPLNFGFVLDISERKQAEENLKKSETRHRSVLKAAVDGFAVTDLEGNMMEVNPAFCRLTGYGEKQLLSMNVSDLELAMDRAQIKKRIAGIVNKGQVRFETGYRHNDGRRLDVEVSSQYQADQGQLLFSFVRDLTEQKKVQKALRQSQKMEAIGTLAGGIAHDFNNILFPIMGHSEMLLDDLTEDDPAKSSVRAILSGAVRAKDLIQQILTFSRQEKTDIRLMKIQPVLKEALKMLRSTIPSTIEIRQHIDPGCGPVKADPTQIHQIIINLATNAYHAMEKKGGKLTVELKAAQGISCLWTMNPELSVLRRPYLSG